MGLSSKSTQEAFIGSPRVRAASLAAACLLLIASLFGVWKVFSLPVETEQPIALASYEHTGEFDYLVYLKPNSLYGPMLPKPEPEEEEEPEQKMPLVFFRDIIEDVDLAFSYKFDLSEAMASITNEVVVTITAESPGKWQKEISVLEECHKGREFRVDFPLRLESLEDVVDDIEEDIGVTGASRQFIINAAVHTTAQTREGQIIEDDFSHEITAIVSTKTLELRGDLKANEEGPKEGIKYAQEGWFDYEVYLKRNKLYEATVLRSERLPVAKPEPRLSPPPPPQTVGPGLVYFLNIVDDIKASFSYQFDCDSPVENLVEEVEVLAILEDPGMWSKTLTLVPRSKKSGPFVIDFPVDLSKFTEVASSLGNELNVNTLPCELSIEAVVHTTADTDSGQIDEVFTHSLEGKLGGPTLSFTGSLDRKQSGTIEGSKLVPAPNVSRFRPLSLLIVAVALFGLFFVLWNTYRVRALGMRLMEVEALRAKRKHKNVVVDVGELPPTGEVIIPVGSVDELVRTADALLKPVLHQVEADKHSYCVIDGAIRYQYISQPERSVS